MSVSVDNVVSRVTVDELRSVKSTLAIRSVAVSVASSLPIGSKVTFETVETFEFEDLRYC